mgnify:FL=1|jgi:hypothetical protein|tara:strand:- start:1973 stop:2269 length:297 start_codon:yes stop_codon:yes gene_type:complete
MNNDKMYYNYKKLEKESRKEIKEDNNNNISYIYKFKIAIYCFILFVLLSNKNTYKILDIIIKIFRRDTNDIINENGEPLIFGICISGLIFSILILFIS